MSIRTTSIRFTLVPHGGMLRGNTYIRSVRIHFQHCRSGTYFFGRQLYIKQGRYLVYTGRYREYIVGISRVRTVKTCTTSLGRLYDYGYPRIIIISNNQISRNRQARVRVFGIPQCAHIG